MATRKNILTACFVAALSVGLAACGSSTTEVVNTPPSLALGGAAAINEGMTGRTGLMVTATDGQDDTITYEVSDARFDVVGGMLVVVAGTLLDYETERSIAVDITASDGALSSDTKTANVTVRNVDDVPLTLSTSGTRGHIVEGKTGSTGLTFMVDDNDDMPGNLHLDADVEGFDVIDLGDGRWELVVMEELDREKMDEVQVVVTATDGHGSKMTPTLTIVVGGVNDNPPMLRWKGVDMIDQGVGMINEGSTGDTRVTFHPNDADGDTEFTFYVEGDNGRFFQVAEVGVQTYELQVTNALDYEVVGGTVEVMVTVADSGGMSTTETVNVMVNDVNDNAPRVTTMGSAAINEGITGGTGLTVTAVDDDLVDGTPELEVDDERFGINRETGELVLFRNPIDYDGEMGKESVEVRVRANDGDRYSDWMPVKVTINPVNDNPPVIRVDGTQANLNEGTFAEAMETGITVSVADEDGGMAASPMVSGDPMDRFTVVDGKLMIVAGSKFDYEMMEDQSITLTIAASDGKNDAIEKTIDVTFMNLNDSAPKLEVTHNQGGPALKVVTRDEGLVSANTPTGHKVKVEDADTDTPLIQWAVVSDKERFYIDEDGYLMIKAGSVFDFEEEDDKIIKLEITANDGKNDAEDPYTITFNIADVDEPPMIAGVKKPELVMGPYGDGHVVTTLTAVDPDDPDTPFAVKWEEVTKDDHNGTVWEWKDNAQGDKYVLSMKSGTFLGIGGPTADSHNEDPDAAYTGYTADNAGTLRRHVVDVDDAELNERARIQVDQKADQVRTSRALATYETYKVEPSDEHEAGATVDEQRMGKPSAEEFIPSFDHLTDGDIKVDERRGGDTTTRLLTDFEIRRGIVHTPERRGGGTSFDNRSENPSLLPVLSPNVRDDNRVMFGDRITFGPGDITNRNIVPDNIGDWYKTDMVSPEIALPMEPMALDIVTDTRSVDINSSAIKKGRELAIRYRWSNYLTSDGYYDRDVALIDDSGRVLEEYRRRPNADGQGAAYEDHEDPKGDPEDLENSSIDENAGQLKRKPDDTNALSIEVDVGHADTRDLMNYAKFGLWSYNNRRGCSNCPDEGLRGATAFGLKARSRDLDNQTHVGVWEGTTVAFWGDKESDGSIDPKDLGTGDGDARIAVNFGNNKVQANMSVSNHRFEFKGGLLGDDRLEYSANIDTTVVLAPQGAIEYTGASGDAGELSSGHSLSADSNGNIHATGSLSGFFYGPSIPAGSTAAAARASTETAGTWEITDVPGRDPNDVETIIIGAFGAGLVENVRIGDDRFTDDPDLEGDPVDWEDIDTGPTGIGGESR